MMAVNSVDGTSVVHTLFVSETTEKPGHYSPQLDTCNLDGRLAQAPTLRVTNSVLRHAAELEKSLSRAVSNC